MRSLALAALLACQGKGDPAEPAPRSAPPAFTAAPPTLRRLTTDQYRNSVRDLFGETVVLPTALEPDLETDGLYAEGASLAGLSALGVEQYEDAAYDLAIQMADPAIHDRLVPCQASATVDDDCAEQALAQFARRAWRRPASPAELEVLVGLAGSAASTLDSFDGGLQYGISAVLQAPAFLYRVELGEPDPGDPTVMRYTSWEMASRLSYFLLGTLPDDELLAAAEAGELVDDAGLAVQVDRLLADPRARDGVRAIFSDILGLAELDDIAKDPLIFLQWSAELPIAAREETLAGIEDLVFDRDADWRELMISRRTFVDRQLAQLYAVPAPLAEGFGPVELPIDGGRRGFLGQASFLVLESHPTTTSVTRRGLYIRERLLCQTMPDPPAGLNTSIPEPSPDAPTMRDRVEVHLSVPECASCHQLMDPIGLGLENFDGVGSWRDTENDVVIDPSGDLDGIPYADAWDLAAVVHDHANLSPCLVERLFDVATGRQPTEAEEELLAWHADGFAGEGYRVGWLLRDLVLSPGFPHVGVAMRRAVAGRGAVVNPGFASRRTLLRGAMNGAAVALALPILESVGGGESRADTGSGFPLRFGLFFWGNGNNPDRWNPIDEGTGAEWALSEQLTPLAAHKDRIAVVTGLSVKLPNIVPHGSGSAGLLSGTRYDGDTFNGPSIDQIIASAVGGATLFRSLQTAATDNLGQSYSGPNLINPAEADPYALYERLFGPTFIEPGGEGIIDPSLGLRRSVLDAVMGDLTALQARVSAADQVRLEQHLDGVRDLESRLARLIEDPPSYEACVRPAEPLAAYPDEDGRPQISARSRAMADLLAMALACDQTRVFGHYLSEPVADVLFPGATKGHHSLTHDEGGDQPECNAIVLQCVAEFAALLDALRAIPEGDETLLDHSAVLCCSEVSKGQTHSLDEMPLVIAGGACGQIAMDTHVRAVGKDNASKLMLTLVRAAGVAAASFGVDEAYTEDGFSGVEA